ncbi:glycosyltransferase family 2 protein [Paludibacter sp. 221]|uniref:glycosyltransferase family 2 protein n=1 Tax=Paludibacter sp. 221 TaxID=2302939 RepID=UPI0013D28686|nr:glycosyltransferase family 2 protein [Paludibacter sp. 221]NDV47426.1 glycosyltransferase family 2 protein [Paludibacter sp. 221]
MVSVCLATYNGEKYIKEQLQSILSQIGDEDEVIISDDGSIDNTLSIIEGINDARIKLFHNTGEHGFSKNFVNALNQAQGEYIFLSDQDDVWLPDKYEIVLPLLKEYDLVVTNSSVTDENLNIIKPSFFSYYNSGKGILKNIIYSTYYGSCMAFRKTVFEDACPFPESKEIGFDVWIGLVAEMTGKVFFLDKPLLLYRRHSNTVTSSGNLLNRSNRTLFQKLRGRIIMLKHVISFYLRYKFSCKKA